VTKTCVCVCVCVCACVCVCERVCERECASSSCWARGCMRPWRRLAHQRILLQHTLIMFQAPLGSAHAARGRASKRTSCRAGWAAVHWSCCRTSFSCRRAPTCALAFATAISRSLVPLLGLGRRGVRLSMDASVGSRLPCTMPAPLRPADKNKDKSSKMNVQNLQTLKKQSAGGESARLGRTCP